MIIPAPLVSGRTSNSRSGIPQSRGLGHADTDSALYTFADYLSLHLSYETDPHLFTSSGGIFLITVEHITGLNY